MKMIWVLLALFLSSCGSVEQVQEFPIIHGQKCMASEFPSSVEILVDALIDASPVGIHHMVSQICGGTLIRPDVVLTAAHCLDEDKITGGFGKLLKLHFAVISDSDLKTFRQGKKIPSWAIWASRWKKHELYGEGNEDQEETHDIGLLFLSQSLWIEPAKMLSLDEREHLKVGAQVDIVGWGQQAIERESQDRQTVLHKMCAKTMINEVRDFAMQIGSDEKSSRKCYGDSGGATYLTLPGGELRLIGITSHSYDSEGCIKGGIDMRVDAHLDWIYQQLNMVE